MTPKEALKKLIDFYEFAADYERRKLLEICGFETYEATYFVIEKNGDYINNSNDLYLSDIRDLLSTCSDEELNQALDWRDEK